jgi:hypothetical protein
MKKGAIKIAANIILNETICNGSNPSNTSNLRNRNDPPQNRETNSNVKKSFVFIVKKKPLKRGYS